MSDIQWLQQRVECSASVCAMAVVGIGYILGKWTIGHIECCGRVLIEWRSDIGRTGSVITLWFVCCLRRCLQVFMAAALFNSCRLPLTLFLPIGIQFLIECRISVKRIQVGLSYSQYIKSVYWTLLSGFPVA